MVDLTVLRLTGVGVPPYSARGLVQTLTPIEAARSLQRTINGRLVDTSFEGYRKFGSTIVGRDQQPPIMMWPGRRVLVDCITELAVSGDQTSETVIDGRPVVAGSARLDSGFTIYRPQLNMLVVDLSVDKDEWGAVVSWSLSLEEDTYEEPTE